MTSACSKWPWPGRPAGGWPRARVGAGASGTPGGTKGAAGGLSCARGAGATGERIIQGEEI